MKKTALIGLMTLSIGGVAQALDLEFIDTTGDGQWTTVGDGVNPTSTNWQTSAVDDGGDPPVIITPAAPHYGVPTASDNVLITSDTSGNYKNAVVNTSGVDKALARNVNLQNGGNGANLGAHLTVTASGELDARAIISAKNVRLINDGVINLSTTFTWASSLAEAENNGTINTDLDLSLNKNVVFNMFGGEFNSGRNLKSGTTSGQILNVHGGIMNFTDTNAFDVGTAGNLTVDFANAGTLIFDLGADQTRYDELLTVIGSAITAGYITTDGVALSGATVVENDTDNIITLTAVPEPSTYALLAGFLGLTWVMLRRRK